MSKTIKIKELLNMEELPKKIKISDELLERTDHSVMEALYCNKYEKWWLNALNISLDDEVEIIEEQEEINIQNMDEIHEIFIENSTCGDDVKFLARKYNELVQAVKQLDKNIKEK